MKISHKEGEKLVLLDTLFGGAYNNIHIIVENVRGNKREVEMKRKRFGSRLSIWMLVFLLMFSMGVQGSYGEETSGAAITIKNNDRFQDLQGHWAESIINEAASLGIVGGYPDGTFLPDNLIKREEFYKLLSNILTVTPDTTSTTIQFSDVVDYEWYVPTIKIAVAAGITSGYGDGTFGIGRMISRQEAAKVAGSVIAATNLDTSKSASSAKDQSEISDWAFTYVDLMFKKGYMQGDAEGNFRPTTALTRAEAATILLNMKKHEAVIVGDAATKIDEPEAPTTEAITVSAIVAGAGTKTNPYLVATASDLAFVREHANEDAFFVQNRDIVIKTDMATEDVYDDVSNSNWSEGNFIPIGSKEKPFVGYYDGNGHTIEGLDIKGTMKDSGDVHVANYAGLFRVIGETSVVENITIEDANIQGVSNIGAVVGLNQGTIENCTVASDVVISGDNQTGGIAGRSEGFLINNTNKGSVTGTGTYTGGIAGAVNHTGKALSGCINYGVVVGVNHTGGIAGMVTSAGSATVEDCHNKGKVTADTGNAGGVTGLVNYSDIDVIGCSNSGKIVSRDTGGIAGFNRGRIKQCYNTGSISGSNYAGGIAANQSEAGSKVNQCYNTGNVYSLNNAGGVVGISETKVYHCYNSGEITGGTNVGGLIGKNVGMLWSCYNAGEVTGENGEGSLVGRNAGEIQWLFWLEGSSDVDTGLNDSGATKSGIKMVSKSQLSGQSDVSLLNDTGTLVELLNKDLDSDLWKFVEGDSYSYPKLIL